jgi:hypothetical protein
MKWDEGGQTGQHIKCHFENLTGCRAEDCKLTHNFGKWAKAVQKFWFSQCKEDFGTAKVFLGALPQLVTKQAVRPKKGPIREREVFFPNFHLTRRKKYVQPIFRHFLPIRQP